MEQPIILAEKLICYLQRLEYEAAGRRIVVERMLNAGESGPAFAQYHREYLDAITEKELALEELRRMYAPAAEGYSIAVDFASRTLRLLPPIRGCKHGNETGAVSG